MNIYKVTNLVDSDDFRFRHGVMKYETEGQFLLHILFIILFPILEDKKRSKG